MGNRHSGAVNKARLSPHQEVPFKEFGVFGTAQVFKAKIGYTCCTFRRPAQDITEHVQVGYCNVPLFNIRHPYVPAVFLLVNSSAADF